LGYMAMKNQADIGEPNIGEPQEAPDSRQLEN
jgi:hypothetical protein